MSKPMQGPGGQPSGIVMHFQGSSLTYLSPPTMRINGQHVPAGSGERFYPAAPGRYHVDVHMSWMRDYGQAGCDVDVAPGQQSHLWYGPPATQFQRGSIGPVKQKRAGLAVSYAVGGAVVLFVVLAVLLAALL